MNGLSMTLARLYVGHEIPGARGVWDAYHVRQAIRNAMLDHGVSGATFTKGRGVWRGSEEPCTVVDLLVSPDTARSMASDIAVRLQQHSVLVVCSPVETDEVKGVDP